MPASIQCPRRALATAVVLALAATGAQAAMITVADGGDSGSTSSCTLRQAIAAANSDLDQTGISTCTQGSGNDLIVFDGALQNSTITLSGYQLEISTSMTISGTSQTLDGAGLTRVLLVHDNLEAVVLSDLRITGGNAGPFAGGGICIGDSNQCKTAIIAVSEPRAAPTAPDLAPLGTRMALDHVIVSNNAGGDRAGGISCRHGMYTASLTLTQSVVSANTLGLAGGGGVKGGGGIYANCALRITDSTIAGNSAHPGSGDIYYLAGGIFLESSDARMVNTTISGNAAMLSKKYAAGALSVNSSDLSVLTVLTNCTVSGNAATATPPGMASPALAVGYIADGIHVGTGNTGSVLLYNSIVAGNGAGADLVVVNGSASAGYSLLGAALSGSYAGNGNVFSDMPLLAPLNDNGGPTPTRALTPGSPALNVGDPALALSLAGAPLNYDQRGRGFPRTLGDTIDIGAFQHVGPDRIFADGNEPEP